MTSWTAQGYTVARNVVSTATCERLARDVGSAIPQGVGTRNLLAAPWCAALAADLCAHPGLRDYIGAGHVAVQCTYFEKSTTRNWLVPVHQDLSIPVAERVDAPGLTGWSEKEREVHVQPPVALLEQLVAVRLHLDPCAACDGPLLLVPGTHRLGRLSADAAAELKRTRGTVSCDMAVGDALVLRPLLLHASSKATGTSRRRVLHFLFGPPVLPCGLAWREVDHGAEVRGAHAGHGG